MHAHINKVVNQTRTKQNGDPQQGRIKHYARSYKVDCIGGEDFGESIGPEESGWPADQVECQTRDRGRNQRRQGLALQRKINHQNQSEIDVPQRLPDSAQCRLQSYGHDQNYRDGQLAHDSAVSSGQSAINIESATREQSPQSISHVMRSGKRLLLTTGPLTYFSCLCWGESDRVPTVAAGDT